MDTRARPIVRDGRTDEARMAGRFARGPARWGVAARVDVIGPSRGICDRSSSLISRGTNIPLPGLNNDDFTRRRSTPLERGGAGRGPMTSISADGGDAPAGVSSSERAKKGDKGKHIPRDVWRAMHPEAAAERDRARAAADPDFGMRGGPARGRMVGGVMRTQAELEVASPHNLRLWGLPSAEAYFDAEDARERDKRETDAFVRNPANAAADKHHVSALHHMRFGRSLYNCPKCWLAKGCCVCHTLTAARLRPHRVAVYMHMHEYGRGSSTGNLIRECLGGELLVAGNRDHEDRLRRLCEERKGRVAVLWPRDAVDARDIARDAPLAGADERARDDGDATQTDDGWTFVAIDGTWNCARKMLARFPPGVARVSIPPEAFAALGSDAPAGGSLLAPVRKYAGHPEAEGRCSTFEATVALFRALGLPGEECKALLENVKVKVDAVLAQKNMPSAYGRGKDDLWPGGWAEAAGPPGGSEVETKMAELMRTCA